MLVQKLSVRMRVFVCMCVNQVDVNHIRCITQSCNPACTHLLMNCDHKGRGLTWFTVFLGWRRLGYKRIGLHTKRSGTKCLEALCSHAEAAGMLETFMSLISRLLLSVIPVLGC